MTHKLADLGTRFFYSALMILLVSSLLFYSNTLFVSWVLATIVSLLAAAGVWEFSKLVNLKGVASSRGLNMVLSVLVVLLYFMATQGWISFYYPCCTLFFGIVALFVNRFGYAEDAILKVATDVLAVLYVTVPLMLIFSILYNHEEGRYWCFYLVAVTKMTDVGGYFVGRLIGKRPLALQLSPKKTVEGCFGGLAAAMIVSVLFSTSFGLLSLGHAIILGGVLGIFSLVGDLSESLLKRDAKVKDSNSIPGIGGILDTLDSLMFNIPLLYFYLVMLT